MVRGSVGGDSGKSDRITLRGYLFVAAWAVVILSLATAAGYGISSTLYHYKADSMAIHNFRASSGASDSDVPGNLTQKGEEQNPENVLVGIYVNGIPELSVKDNKWAADFYIWFRWVDDKFKPGDNFQVINGAIESKSKQAEYSNGQEHYAQYQVTAKINKFFNVSRFPCDDHILIIDIEDSANSTSDFNFVPDVENSNISSLVKVPGYRIFKTSMATMPHVYGTNFGDPEESDGSGSAYSQFIYGIWIVRPNLGLYIKIFQGLFIAVAISLLAFFIKPIHTSPRFSVGLGALFAAVANGYIVSSMQPGAGILTMADMVCGVGIATIFLSLVQSTMSLYIYDSLGKTALSRLFDLASVVVFVLGYAAINVVMPLSAYV